MTPLKAPCFAAGRRVARSASLLLALVPALISAVLVSPAFAAGDGEFRWSPLGPDGGRSSAVLASQLDPGVIFAGLGVGGVYRSMDSGITWSPWSDGLTAARINAFDQSADGTLYAATNRGVYRLDVGASTWSTLGQGLGTFPYASQVRVDPKIPGRLYATISNGFITGSWTLYRSDDRGDTWQEVQAAPFIASVLAVAATEPATVLTGSSSGVERSEDGGATWQTSGLGSLSIPVFRDILSHPTVPNLLYASARDLLSSGDSFAILPHRSDNGGRTWRSIADGLGARASSRAGIFAVDPATPDRVYFTTNAGVYLSEDRGDTWRPLNAPPGDIEIEGVTVAAGEVLLGAGTAGTGVLRSADGGETWQESAAGFIGARVKAISPDPVLPGRIVAVQDGQLIVSDDDGMTWSEVGGESAVRSTRFIRDPGAPATIRVAGQEGLLISEDSGATWRRQGPPLALDTLVHDRATGALLAAVDGQVRRSDDGGLTWPAVGDVLCNDLSLAPPRNGVWIAGCTGAVFLPGVTAPSGDDQTGNEKSLPMFSAALLRSDDQGATWTLVRGDLGGLFGGSWHFSESTAPLTHGPIFASLLDPASGLLLRSDDAGLTWSSVPSLPGSVRSLIDDRAAGRLLAGTFERGVFESRDDGVTWQALNAGLLSGRVNSLALDARDESRLWAATDGGAHRYDGSVASRCPSSDRVLCLLDRFQVEVSWTDFEGRTGHGTPLPMTPNTGGFWFFGPDNLEFALKILDGRAFNDHFWLFYGGLSTVEYRLTVTDLETGTVRIVENTSGQLEGGADTFAFPAPATPDGSVGIPSGPSPQGSPQGLAAVDGPLRLQGDRFELEVRWRTEDGATGVATGTQLSPDTAAFSFFDADNLEIFAKVLDGRGFNGHFWLFFTGLSNVAYDLVVTDTETGEMRIYTNPQGDFGGLADTQLF